MIDFGLITSDSRILKRSQELSSEFGYEFRCWQDSDAFAEDDQQCRFLVSATSSDSADGAAEAVQVVRQLSPGAYLVSYVPGNKINRDQAAFIKKSGANAVFTGTEYFDSSKLEFACTQAIRAQYVPIKVTDLLPQTQLTFDIIHLMPQRQKFLKLIREGDRLDSDRLARLGLVSEFYIGRNQVERFKKYVEDNQQKSAKGLAQRCRFALMTLYVSFTDLVFLLTDRSEAASFQKGEALIKRCRELAQGLLSALAEFGNAWDIIDNSVIGSFGSVERAPAVACYVGVFGLQADMPNLEEVMLAALLAELGLLYLPPNITRKLRLDEADMLSPDESKLYCSYPLKSANTLAENRIAIDPLLRQMLTTTHERVDGNGFPNGVDGAKIPEGAQLIQFCSEFDRRTILRMGRPRPDRLAVRSEMIEAALKGGGVYSPDLIMKLKRAFSS